MDSTLASRIAETVRISGLSRSEFAKRLGISAAYTTQLCSGVRSPSERTIYDICEKFGVDEIWLRTGDGQPFRQQTKEEVLAEVFSKAKVGPDTQRRLVQAFSRLPVEDYEAMEKIFLHIVELMASSSGDPPETPGTEKETP